MSDRIGSAAGVPGVRVPPRWVFSFFNPIAKFLLVAGVPMGFNGLVTIRGRRSGLPRTTPMAIIQVSGRRWVWAPLCEQVVAIAVQQRPQRPGGERVVLHGRPALGEVRVHRCRCQRRYRQVPWTIQRLR
jgi:hypothetical protein